MMEWLSNLTVGEIVGFISSAVIICSGIIQISPLKLNPWTWLGNLIGSWINGRFYDKQEKIEKDIVTLSGKVDKLEHRVEEENIITNRTKILRFSDEIRHGERHSEEHFKEILRCITEYKQYCRTHPDFLNSYAEHAMRLIENTYDKVNAANDFLE